MSVKLIRILHFAHFIALLLPCPNLVLASLTPSPPVNYNQTTPKASANVPFVPDQSIWSGSASTSEAASRNVPPVTISDRPAELAPAPILASTSSRGIAATSAGLAMPAVLTASASAGTHMMPVTPVIPAVNPTPPSACMWAQCNLFYQYVSVYYWPEASQNTACLSTMPNPPHLATLAGLAMQSPSVYVIFNSVTASNGCTQIGGAYSSITTSFPRGSLSTIRTEDNTTRSFNFADLPCPPPGVEWTSTGPYAPLISPPPFLFGLDPAFADCIPAYHQGVDPPSVVTTVTNGITGPGRRPAGHPNRQYEGAVEHAHVVPSAPQKTAGQS